MSHIQTVYASTVAKLDSNVRTGGGKLLTVTKAPEDTDRNSRPHIPARSDINRGVADKGTLIG